MNNFVKDFILSGLVVSVSAVLIKDERHELSGLLYGALPIGFLYLLFVANMNRQTVIAFARETYVGGIFFLLYTFLTYLLFRYTDLSIVSIVLIATILFVVGMYLTRKNVFHGIVP